MASLLYCCTVDWCHEWPTEALCSVAIQHEAHDKVYGQITDLLVMQERAEVYLKAYDCAFTITFSVMVFLDACEHAAHALRVLDRPSGCVSVVEARASLCPPPTCAKQNASGSRSPWASPW